MGIKWTARLRVDFEMEDGASENLAQARLRTSVSRFRQYIESGETGTGSFVKHGSARVEIVAQGPTA
jgi:hypothetical protein